MWGLRLNLTAAREGGPDPRAERQAGGRLRREARTRGRSGRPGGGSGPRPLPDPARGEEEEEEPAAAASGDEGGGDAAPAAPARARAPHPGWRGTSGALPPLASPSFPPSVCLSAAGFVRLQRRPQDPRARPGQSAPGPGPGPERPRPWRGPSHEPGVHCPAVRLSGRPEAGPSVGVWSARYRIKSAGLSRVYLLHGNSIRTGGQHLTRKQERFQW